METIALLGKGGTAKTTSTGSLAHALARRGNKVVMLDLDSQASLSDWLLGERGETPMIEDVLLGRAQWKDALVQVADNLQLVPTKNFALPAVEKHIDDMARRREHLIGDALKQLPGDFDYCFVDTPRGLDTNIAANVFECMDWALIATEPSPMSLTAQREIVLAIRDYEEVRDTQLLAGVLPTRYTHTSLSRMALEAMGEEGSLRVFHAVRHTVKASEAIAVDKLLWDYDKACTASQDYETAAEELLAAMSERRAA